jgi:hypothetical protein
MMKAMYSGILVLGLVASPSVKADVETVKVTKTASASMNCFENFDTKIENLENYTVTYVEPNKSKTVLRGRPASADSSNRKADESLQVRMIPAGKKS